MGVLLLHNNNQRMIGLKTDFNSGKKINGKNSISASSDNDSSIIGLLVSQ